MRDPGFIDEQRAADYLDCMADIHDELVEAMRDTNPEDWDGMEDISREERYACDMYNERYYSPTGD